jgi:hypothetical protein
MSIVLYLRTSPIDSEIQDHNSQFEACQNQRTSTGSLPWVLMGLHLLHRVSRRVPFFVDTIPFVPGATLRRRTTTTRCRSSSSTISTFGSRLVLRTVGELTIPTIPRAVRVSIPPCVLLNSHVRQSLGLLAEKNVKSRHFSHNLQRI